MSISPDARVLRADLRWARADELVPGVEIVAFDESAPGGMGGRRKWRKTTVIRADHRIEKRIRVIADGAELVASCSQRLLCTARSASGAARGEGIQARSENPQVPGYGQRWVRADRLLRGDRIVFLRSPWPTGTSFVHGYLKGISDGEAYVDKGCAKIGIAQNPGPVLDEIGDALLAMGFTTQLRNANGYGRVQQRVITGLGECMRFLGEVRPTRLLRSADGLYDGRMICGGARKNAKPTASSVLSIVDVDDGPSIEIETNARTLVSEGLCVAADVPPQPL